MSSTGVDEVSAVVDLDGVDPSPPSSHLLEVTVLSAQDLAPASSRSMRTYAIAYVLSKKRQRTRLDATGHTNPSWDDKFVFHVDDAILSSNTSVITVEVYAKIPNLFLPGHDVLLGTARAVLSSLLLPNMTRQLVALQLRRPRSLPPQGILDLGVALIDQHARSISPINKTGPGMISPPPSITSYFVRPPKDPAFSRRTKSASSAEGIQAMRKATSGDSAAQDWEELRKWRAELPDYSGTVYKKKEEKPAPGNHAKNRYACGIRFSCFGVNI